MTIASTVRQNVATANGSTDVFNYTFKIIDETDLLVETALNGVSATKALNTDYTVTGVGETGGGTVTFLSMPANNTVISISRVRPLTQLTDIRNQGEFYPEIHEDAFDHLVMISQQVNADAKRSVRLPSVVDPTTFDATLPVDIATQTGKPILVNSTGDGFEMGPSQGDIASAQANAAAALASANAAAASATTALGYQNLAELAANNTTVHPNCKNISLYSDGTTLTFATLELSGFDTGTEGAVILPKVGVDPLGSQGFVVIPMGTYAHELYFKGHPSGSNITGEEFGTTGGVAWAKPKPLYIYAINTNDLTSGLRFGISPCPTLTKAPASLNAIGYKGNPAVDTNDQTLFVWYHNKTDVINAPVVRIGGVLATKDASDDWTLETTANAVQLSPRPFDDQVFDMPGGQGGAAAGNYFIGNGPTWATPASIQAQYTLSCNGDISYWINTSGAGNCTNGSDTNAMQIPLPISTSGSGPHYVSLTGVPTFAGYATLANSTGLAFMTLSSYRTAEMRGSTGVAVINNAFSHANDDVKIAIRFRGF